MQRRRGHLVAYMNPIVNQELQKGTSIDQMWYLPIKILDFGHNTLTGDTSKWPALCYGGHMLMLIPYWNMRTQGIDDIHDSISNLVLGLAGLAIVCAQTFFMEDTM